MATEQALTTLADIQTGYPFRGKVKGDPLGSHIAIQSRDIDDALNLKLDGITRFRMPANARSEGKQLQSGDILVMSRTEKPYAIQIPQAFPPAVAHTSFYTIRIRKEDRLLASFLTLSLNSNLLQNRLQSLIKGTSIPYIRIDDLRTLPIPLPTLEKQKQIVRLHEAFLREAALHRKLEATRQELIDDLILSA